ncbi:hypothetical protein Tco_1057810 [Tanacetum coccineum]|uniref:Uncharacterized protein n=1 Tax=Tanacetum coccineum TaxID=301880 RepID=A0ABQ5H8I1_9ASTR
MDAPTIPVSADSYEGNFGDAIDIGMDVVHPVPVAAVAFPVVTTVTTLARHGEAIRGIHEHLQGVPIEEDMSTLRFRMGMAKVENASLCGKIRTMEAIETVTRSQERRACMEMERQLALVQESQREPCDMIPGNTLAERQATRNKRKLDKQQPSSTTNPKKQGVAYSRYRWVLVKGRSIWNSTVVQHVQVLSQLANAL